MAGVLTDEQLREIHPPAGDIGDRQYNEFDATLSAALGAVNASAARLVALIRRCLLEGWWQAAGTHSPDHWVMARCAVDRARANRLVRIARELGDYPTVAGVFAAGSSPRTTCTPSSPPSTRPARPRLPSRSRAGTSRSSVA